MFYLIILPLTWLAFHIVFRIKVVGRENLIRDRGFVMVCNHLHALDPVFLIIARFWGRRLVIIGKEELFQINPFISWFLRSVNVVPISRGKGDTGLLDEISKKVQGGQGFLIFPEGTRSKDGKLGRLKSGAFLVAAAAKADVMPCRVIYRGGKLKLFGHVCVVFGRPIAAEKMMPKDQQHSAGYLRECKALVAQALEQLLIENEAEQ